MQRVQAALKAQLTRQSEKLEIELREKVISGRCIFALIYRLCEDHCLDGDSKELGWRSRKHGYRAVRDPAAIGSTTIAG